MGQNDVGGFKGTLAKSRFDKKIDIGGGLTREDDKTILSGNIHYPGSNVFMPAHVAFASGNGNTYETLGIPSHMLRIPPNVAVDRRLFGTSQPSNWFEYDPVAGTFLVGTLPTTWPNFLPTTFSSDKQLIGGAEDLIVLALSTGKQFNPDTSLFDISRGAFNTVPLRFVGAGSKLASWGGESVLLFDLSWGGAGGEHAFVTESAIIHENFPGLDAFGGDQGWLRGNQIGSDGWVFSTGYTTNGLVRARDPSTGTWSVHSTIGWLNGDCSSSYSSQATAMWVFDKDSIAAFAYYNRGFSYWDGSVWNKYCWPGGGAAIQATDMWAYSPEYVFVIGKYSTGPNYNMILAQFNFLTGVFSSSIVATSIGAKWGRITGYDPQNVFYATLAGAYPGDPDGELYHLDATTGVSTAINIGNFMNVNGVMQGMWINDGR